MFYREILNICKSNENQNDQNFISIISHFNDNFSKPSEVDTRVLCRSIKWLYFGKFSEKSVLHLNIISLTNLWKVLKNYPIFSQRKNAKLLDLLYKNIYIRYSLVVINSFLNVLNETIWKWMVFMMLTI